MVWLLLLLVVVSIGRRIASAEATTYADASLWFFTGWIQCGHRTFFQPIRVCKNRARASQVAKPRVQRQNPRREGKKNKKKIDYIPSYFWVSPCTTRRAAAAHYRFVFFGGPARLPETERFSPQVMTQVEPPRIFSRFNSPPHTHQQLFSESKSIWQPYRAGRPRDDHQPVVPQSRGLGGVTSTLVATTTTTVGGRERRTLNPPRSYKTYP